jgi:K+-sensing histidine kinase KdpD
VLRLEKEERKKSNSLISEKVVSEFIHKLSHDVTGISHNIMGYATLLVEENKKEYIEGITRLIAKLNERIKLAVSTVDNGELEKLG